MLERGWTNSDLNAMTEAEFGWWYEEAIALEKAKAEAIRKAQAST